MFAFLKIIWMRDGRLTIGDSDIDGMMSRLAHGLKTGFNCAFISDDFFDVSLITAVIASRRDPKIGHVAVIECSIDAALEIVGIGHKANEKGHRDRSDGDDGEELFPVVLYFP